MATNRTSDGLTRLLAASGLGSGDAVGSEMTSIADQLQQQQSMNDALMQQTVAAMTQPESSGSSGGSTGSSILSTIGGVLSGGLGLASVVSGLAGLFGGGGDSSTPAALPTYTAPLPINIDAGFSEGGGGAYGVDSAQGGAPRAMTNSTQAAQITVQVQAMDSSSFLDHSQDIALAVRHAMLQSTVLNDVIRDV
ncbi:MAG: hypothetical protein M3O20_13110 [Acidobacteriota bacterium]|nr:hypothetical protein [Acidobacteriota bacterium]